MKSIEKLLSISSGQLSRLPAVVDFGELGDFGGLGEQLRTVLRMRNGFYAFESSLHVFPADPQNMNDEITLSQWNSFDLWRFEYRELADQTLFFAEDAFGNQFCLNDGRVCLFDAETGELSVIARDLEGWADRLLAEYAFLTGYPVLHKWHEKNGPVPVGSRLVPKIPFVLGGEYNLTNLTLLNSVQAMRSRGNLARQLKDLPDGSQVVFRLEE
jgi:hypothetical protein